jgi:DNA-binding MarR family transcriptional regulator
MSPDSPLAVAILAALATAPPPGFTSLPRLSKRLGIPSSVLLRELSQMGAAEIAGRPGPGWVRVEQDEERWIVHLTPLGREAAASIRTDLDAEQ